MVPAASQSADGAAPTAALRQDGELQGLIGASGLLVFAGLFTALGNVGFQTLVARAGNVADYGVASGLFAAAGVAVFLAAGLQYSVGRVASLSTVGGRGLLRLAVPGIYPWLALSALAAALSPALARYLHLGSALPVLLTVVYALAMVGAGLPAGVLIGRRRFRAYAVSVGLAVVVRIGAGAILAVVLPGVDGALVASIVGAGAFLVALAAATTSATALPGIPGLGSHAPRVRFGDAVPGSIVAGLLWCVWTFPLIAARHVLAPGAVGDFGAANLFASGIIMLAGPLTTVLYPSLVRSRGQRVFAVGLAATTAMCAALTAALVALGPLAIELVYGGRYRVGAGVLFLLAVSATATTLWTYLLWVLRARGNDLRGVLLVACVSIAVEVVLSLLPPLQDAHWLAVSSAVALLVGSGANVVRHLLRMRRAAPATHPLFVDVQATNVPPAHGPVASLLPELAVGMMVHNEEATLEQCMRAVLDEHDGEGRVARLVVVSSGSTDASEAIVRRLADKDDRVVLVSEPERQGKVAAVNRFLSLAPEPIGALVNADTLLAPGSLTRLVEPLRHPEVGMVGGRVVPLNVGRSLPVRMVRLLWNLHHEVSTTAPKLGEVVVFRRTFDHLESMSAADEVALEFEVTKAGQLLRYVPDAVVYNFGAGTIGDYFRHRTRIHRQHLGFKRRTRYVPSTMRWWAALVAIGRTILDRPEEMVAACALVGIELASRANANLGGRLAALQADGWEPIVSAKRRFADHRDEGAGAAVPAYAPPEWDMEAERRSISPT